ncbi:hypothetical protein MCGE09_00378 [Thaumarchaeota archaeon SCGC AB-539-E09]|nr:hypothetical protein MCGE09_00378 [Thaumarchaeota archaeon SCGC AB-539-E09]
MGSEVFQKVIRQNEVLISLLGRIAFTEDKVREIVTKNKRVDLRVKYIEGYNACDGNKTITEIAKIIGVDTSTASPIFNDWEDIGIIYESHKKGTRARYYRKIFPI